MKRILPVAGVFLAGIALAAVSAQQAQPTPTPQPAPSQPTMDALRGVRMKISAGDLPSAESILAVHRAKKGEDGEYLLGLAWLAESGAGGLPDGTGRGRRTLRLAAAWSARGVMNLLRTMPELLWALFLVLAVGLRPRRG